MLVGGRGAHHAGQEQIVLSHLPLNIDMHDRNVLVVGGGMVACRKVRTLLESGAVVHVVTPALSSDLAELARTGCITMRSGRYEPGDLAGMFMVIAASDDTGVNAGVAADAAIPAGPFGDLVRLGQNIFQDTPRYAPEFVGNTLSCRNCHLDRGRSAESAS